MAIQQLNLKLDQMNEELVDQQQRKEIASVPMPETVAYGTMTPAQPELQDEGIQVAGGRGEVLREILGKVKKVEIRKPPAAPLTPQAATAAAVEDTTKAAINAGVATTKKEVRKVNIAAKIEANKQPEITPEAFTSQRAEVQKIRAVTDPATEVPPETVFNHKVIVTTWYNTSWYNVIILARS